MQEALLVFVLKTFDNILATAKTISVAKGKYKLGAFFNAFSTLFYLISIIQVAESNSMLSIIAMCIATYIGTLIPGLVVNKYEKEKLYIYEITAPNIEEGKIFGDMLRAHNIAVRSYKTYDKNMNKTLSFKVYCNTKEESKAINSLIPDNYKYNIYISKED